MLKKNKAFTLVELLVILAGVGLIVSMTVPTVIQRHNEDKTVAEVKYAYRVLSEAYNLAIVDNGNASRWGLSNEVSAENSKMIADKLTPYLKMRHNCDPGASSWSDCWTGNNSYKVISGDKTEDLPIDTSASAMLEVGMPVLFSKVDTAEQDDIYGTVTVVTDPHMPQHMGRSMFQFYIMKDGLYPAGYKEYDPNELKKGCSGQGSGAACTAWVVYKGNMDYLRRAVDWDK